MNSCEGDAICADDDVHNVDDVEDGDDEGGMNSCQDDAISALSSILLAWPFCVEPPSSSVVMRTFKHCNCPITLFGSVEMSNFLCITMTIFMTISSFIVKLFT